jgi:hypothetical protein
MKMTKDQRPMSKEAPRTKELLVACPLCHQGGFTARGLRSHWCDKNGKKPLAKEAVQAVVDAAKGSVDGVDGVDKVDAAEAKRELCSECQTDRATTWAFDWMRSDALGNRPMCGLCKEAVKIVNTSVDDAKHAIRTTGAAGLRRALELELKRVNRRASIIRMVERQLARILERQHGVPSHYKRRYFAQQMRKGEGV